MRVSIHALKRSRPLRAAALAVAFVFLTGQFFACCRINQEIGASLARVWNGLAAAGERAQADAGGDPSRLPHCRGHESGGEAVLSALAAPGGGCAVSERDACLSERAWAGKPMVPGSADAGPGLLPQAPILLVAARGFPSSAERPRPQSKSGPPVYLATLRLLV